MSAIVAMLGGVRATAFALALVFALGWAGVQTYRLGNAQDTVDHLRADKIALKANEKVLTESNGSKDATISTLQAELDKAVGENQRIESARASALTALAAAERDRAKASAAAAQARRDLYAHDEAAREWAARPITLGVSDQLRDIWSDARCRHQGSSGRGEGSAACADPAGAPRDPGSGSAAAAGVFSGDQLLGAVSMCLATLDTAQSQLAAIAQLQQQALATP